MRADDAPVGHHASGMDDQDVIDLLELQRLTRELLDHLTAMFPVEAAAELLDGGAYDSACLTLDKASTRMLSI